jgi:type VI secretion system protein ImpA
MEPDGDWYIRSNAVAGLADPDSVLRVLRDLVAGSVRGIPVTVRNVCALAEGQQPESSPVANLEQLRIAFQDECTECAARFDACSRILAGLASINATFASRLGQDAPPSLQPLQRIVAVLQSLYAPAPAQDPQDQENVAEGSGVTEIPDFSGQVHSRNDALRALAVAREYFERHEPSNPAPLLIKRVERLAASSFLEIIEEMAPSSMDHIKMQTGLSR